MAAIDRDEFREVRDMAKKGETALVMWENHEKVCLERYTQIGDRIGALADSQRGTNRLLIGVGLAIMGGMCGIIGFLFVKVYNAPQIPM